LPDAVCDHRLLYNRYLIQRDTEWLLKIVSWNIRAGGGVRAQSIVDYLLRERPDVIALSEFRGTAASTSIADALALCGYPYQRTTVDKLQPALNSLLLASRYPLRRLRLSRAPDCTARWLAVNVYAPQPVCIMALHVPNRHTGRKYPFLASVLEVVSHWRGLPAVVVGDTNSGCIKIDEETRTFNRIEDAWITSLNHRGWRDAFRLLRPDAREFTWYSPNGRNGFRLDQMFVHPRLVPEVRGFTHQWVGATARRREVVSDHAALLLELGHV
jgi:exodeoxyribonuclease-3